jgi:hypothetical protein
MLFAPQDDPVNDAEREREKEREEEIEESISWQFPQNGKQSEDSELVNTTAMSVEGLQTCVMNGSRCVTSKETQRKSDERSGEKRQG